MEKVSHLASYYKKKLFLNSWDIDLALGSYTKFWSYKSFLLIIWHLMTVELSYLMKELAKKDYNKVIIIDTGVFKISLLWNGELE